MKSPKKRPLTYNQASVLYTIVKWIVRLTLNSYFRKIVITGYHHVSTKGPVIFVANHPSAFMDPMVVATCINRPIHFLAAAEFFGKGFKAWAYQNLLNMIPVYRPSTLPTETHNNEAVFSKCFELLGSGGALLVFPEGNSVTEKRIRKLKTGVARMALGTKDNSSGKVEVIPIGLNYGNPHRFRSDLFINIGKPLSTKEFSNSKSEVERLTTKIEEHLKKTILHVQHEELDSVVKKVALLLKSEFKTADNMLLSKKDEFTYQQKIIKSIQAISENQPQLITNLELKLDRYLNKIKQLEISDASIAELSILVSGWELLRLIFTLPLFFIGFITNSIPYYLTVFYFRKLNLFSRDGHEPPRTKVNQAFKGSVAMGIGMVFFILCYLIAAAISIWITKNTWIGIGLLIVFYFSGLFCMRYIRWFVLFNQKLKFRKLINKKQDLVTSLIIERQEIMEEMRVVTNEINNQS